MSFGASQTRPVPAWLALINWENEGGAVVETGGLADEDALREMARNILLDSQERQRERRSHEEAIRDGDLIPYRDAVDTYRRAAAKLIPSRTFDEKAVLNAGPAHPRYAAIHARDIERVAQIRESERVLGEKRSLYENNPVVEMPNGDRYVWRASLEMALAQITPASEPSSAAAVGAVADALSPAGESATAIAEQARAGQPAPVDANGSNTGGKPRKFDRDAFHRRIIQIADLDGLPERHELTRLMAQWCIDTWGEQPAESKLREWIAPIYNKNR